MNAKSWLIAAVILAAPAGASRAQPVPILEYRFSETGTTALSTGTTAATLNMRDANNQQRDLHIPNNGVAGFGDTSFLLDATGMGRNSQGGDGFAQNVSTISGLTSFTLQGWFKTRSSQEALGNQARLLQIDSMVLGAPSNSTGTLRLDVFDINGSGASAAASDAAFGVWGLGNSSRSRSTARPPPASTSAITPVRPCPRWSRPAVQELAQTARRSARPLVARASS